MIGRKLKKLDDVISVSVVEPALTDQGWRFGDYPGSDRYHLNGATYLHEIYMCADPCFTGRSTVPVLWDKRRVTIQLLPIWMQSSSMRLDYRSG